MKGVQTSVDGRGATRIEPSSTLASLGGYGCESLWLKLQGGKRVPLIPYP